MAFGASVVGFLVLTVSALYLLIDTNSQLRRNNYDQSGLAAMQIRLHYEHLLAELAMLANQPEAPADAVVLQYDILHGRLKRLPTRPPYDRVMDAEQTALLAMLFEVVDAEAGIIEQLASGDRVVIAGLRERVAGLRGKIERMAGRVVQLATDYRADRRNRMIAISTWLNVLVLGLVISGGLFALVLFRQYQTLGIRNRELTELTEQLIVARDDAVSANLAKSTFLAMTSHELRTPLNAIMGFAEMIKSGYLGPLPQVYRGYADDIHKSGEHLSNLIGEILDLSLIEADKLELREEAIALAPEVEAAMKMAWESADTDGLTVAFVNEAAAVTLNADAQKLRQMVINLVDNAIKYGGEGAHIEVTALMTSEGEPAVRVRDDGVGIAAQDLSHLQEPFTRGVDITRGGGGLGLGLAIVSSLMELHGGRLSISSSHGEGVAATLIFPADRAVPG